MLSEFDATLKSNTIGRFWLMYVHMVLVLKRYIEAEKGLWQQHLTEVDNMLPYPSSAGHTKYVVCIPLLANNETPTTRCGDSLYPG